MNKLLLSLVVFLLPIQSFSTDGRWSEEYGQDNLEYYIDKHGMRLHIACSTEDGSADAASAVSLIRLSDDLDIDKFSTSVNGLVFDGPFDASSRVENENFLAFLNSVKKADMLVKYNGKSVSFPKSNAAKIVPSYGGRFGCNIF